MEKELLIDRRTILENKKVGLIKNNLNSANSSNKNFKNFVEEEVTNVKLEPTVFDIYSEGDSTRTLVQVKEEYEAKSKITYELVSYVNSPDDIKDRSLLALNAGSSSQGLCEKWQKSGKNCYDECGSSMQIDRESPEKAITANQVQIPSKIGFNINSVKFTTVSVRLEDLFSSKMRKLGKAHSNNGPCSCIYCQGEYRLASDLSIFSKEPRNQNETQPHKKFQEKSKIGIRCGEQKSIAIFEYEEWVEKSNNEAASANHKSKLQSSEKPFKCSLCFSTFMNEHGLKTHMGTIHRTVDWKIVGCNLCTFSYLQPTCVHGKKRRYCCNFCHNSFTSRSKVTSHIKLVHSNEKPFGCEFCAAAFKDSSAAKTHMKRVHSTERPFKCNFCPSRFKVKGRLTKHETIHSSKKPFKCASCPAAFRLLDHLKQHLVVHSQERQFKCDVCPATFKLHNHLYEHKMSHSGKPSKCLQCHKVLKTKRCLTFHVKTVHSHDRHFKCDHCSLTFKTRNYIYAHIRQNTSPKPLKCELCCMVFTYKCALNVHEKSVHSFR